MHETDVVAAPKTPLKIFIASSAEVKGERDECVQILNRLHKAHKHLYIEPVLWEYDMPKSNYPGHTNIQDAITQSELKDSPIVVFIFFSRIGKYTREEFEYATTNNKRLFVYFKDGFTPSKQTLPAFSELLDFQESLNDTVLYQTYKDLTDFNGKLYQNLNLYISQTYLPVAAGANTQQDIAAQLAQSEKTRKELEQQLTAHAANDALKAQALEEVKKGNYDAAKDHLIQSTQQRGKELASDFFELGEVSKLQLLYTDAFNYYELAAKIDPENGVYLFNAGQMADTLELNDKAMEYHQKFLAVCNSLNAEENDDTCASYNHLGIMCYRKSEYDKAIGYYEKALALNRKLHSELHPRIGICYNNLGFVYHRKCEYDKAIDYYRRALTIFTRVHGESHPSIGSTYNNLGLAFNRKGEYDKAIDFYNKALTIGKKFYGEEHPDIAIWYNNLGFAYAEKGQYDTAINYYQKVLTIYKKFLPLTQSNIQIVQDHLNAALAAKAQLSK